MSLSKNYYTILGVEETATSQEIKAAYRKLAMLYHPDRNSGNAEGEEILKEINEAYETLGNEEKRFVYDEYRSRLQNTITEDEKTSVKEETKTNNHTNRKTYKRKKTVTEEIRTYLKGRLIVKFYGRQIEKDGLNVLHEIHHTINPTEAEVLIEGKGDEPFDKSVISLYNEQSIFASFLKRPIRCRIVTEQGDKYYSLDIRDIKIGNVKITDVIYEGNDIFGTLEGEIYGYLQTFKQWEEEIVGEECFGETGRVEEKQETGATYLRKEYYYHDCSTYWGPWIQTSSFQTSTPYSAERKNTTSTSHSDYDRNANVRNTAIKIDTVDYSWIRWLLFLLFFVIIFPKLGLFIAIVASVIASFYFGGYIIAILGRIVQLLWVVFLMCFFFFGIKSCFQKVELPRPITRTSGSIKEEILPRRTNKSRSDSLITHYITWQDFHKRQYSAGLSVLASDVKTSTLFHQNLQVPLTYSSSLTPVYVDMTNEDSSKLKFIYTAFDSIMRSNQLNEYYKAAMLVSCVQNFPYAVVVDRDCNANEYTDNFTRSYLQNCNGDCCVGFEQYGVRTPVELLSDLKGDCDTKALLLYILLKHFGYQSALLTSNYYKHALIAVHFNNTIIPNTIIKVIDNTSYYVWETTSFGFDVGQLPKDIADMNYWNVSLVTTPKK